MPLEKMNQTNTQSEIRSSLDVTRVGKKERSLQEKQEDTSTSSGEKREIPRAPRLLEKKLNNTQRQQKEEEMRKTPERRATEDPSMYSERNKREVQLKDMQMMQKEGEKRKMPERRAT